MITASPAFSSPAVISVFLPSLAPTVTFTARAYGTNLTYQWQRGTADIAGATPIIPGKIDMDASQVHGCFIVCTR